MLHKNINGFCLNVNEIADNNSWNYAYHFKYLVWEFQPDDLNS